MFALSFVLEDWAIHELVQSPRHRKVAVMLVASSYVTWTYQTHTFSNSIETLAVAWSLVLIQRIVEKVWEICGDSGQVLTVIETLLDFCIGDSCVCGSLWDIQPHYFPSFLVHSRPSFVTSLLQKVCSSSHRPVLANTSRPFSLLAMIFSALVTTFVAIYLDTKFYTDHSVDWSYLFSHPTITPFNNLTYNLATSNLATHGLHPWYQHVLLNLPQLIGPAAFLLFLRPHLSLRLYSAISGVFVLSIFQHQEARFLLPTIPLILSSVRLPKNPKYLRVWTSLWIIFNIFFGLLMGVYHQGGVIPAQVFLSKQQDATQAIWWKTYSPPVWLLNGKNEVLTTHDIMGMKGNLMLEQVVQLATCHKLGINASASGESDGTYLIAPLSSTFLDKYTQNQIPGLYLEKVWQYGNHLNLDDLDFGDDGFFPTVRRVIGRRGIAAWRATLDCPEDGIKNGDVSLKYIEVIRSYETTSNG